MAAPLTIRPFRGQQAGAGNVRRFAPSSSGAGRAMAYLGSSPSNSPPCHEPYLTLGITSGAPVHEIKTAYRRLALQFHPDVCKGESCTNKFMQINDAYETVMGFLRGDGESMQQYYSVETMAPEPMMGVHDEDWDDWEEWMGWEGAGTLDYSNHVNPSL